MGPLIFKTDPFDHQRAATERFINAEYGAFFCEMGTGKTKMMLDILRNAERPQRVLIAAPNGLHMNWFHSELPKHLNAEDYAVFEWRGPHKSQKRKKTWTQFLNHREKHLVFFLINIEAIRTPNGFKCANEFLKNEGDYDNVYVIDESTCIKNPKAIQTKNSMKLADLCQRRFILNGTPITQGPLDTFAQCRFLSKDALNCKTYTAFKAMYALETTMTMGNRSFRKIIGYQNLEHLTRQMDPFSLRLKKEDCLDLPDKIFAELTVEITHEQ